MTAFLPSPGQQTAVQRAALSGRYDHLIAQYSAENRLHPRLVKALIAAESDFDHRAVSPSGAIGLMQLMPQTAEGVGVRGVHLMDPESNIRAGTAFLDDLYSLARRRYGLKETGLRHAPVWVQRRVLAGYHAGPRMMYRDKWPKSTTIYVGRVMRYTTTPRSTLRLAKGV